MELPKIGSIVTTEEALKLCEYFNLDYLIKRIDANRDRYKSWVFDGCSCLIDQKLGFITGCDWKDITFKCCLPHDLCYAYGEVGNDIERERVDIKFCSDLITKAGMVKWKAYAFLAGVRIGGAEEFGLSFTWAFANKNRKE